MFVPAAQWVSTARTTRTIGGGWRADNGLKSPYGVKYWCVGNEMFGPWQLGFMQMQHYTLKHNLVADAMHGADPTVVLTAVGDLETINKQHDPDQAKSGKTCTRIMLEECADHMNLISEHFYQGRVPWTQEGRVDLSAHVSLLKRHSQESRGPSQTSGKPAKPERPHYPYRHGRVELLASRLCVWRTRLCL
jgi:alpha-N-arabinofuranosidase